VPQAEQEPAIVMTCPPPVAPIAVPAIEPQVIEPPAVPTVPDPPAVLDEIGGEEALKPLAREITWALLADPVLRRNPRLTAMNRTRLETAVRQQLIYLVDANAESDPIDTTELMWEIRPTHGEWEAATQILDKALEKHKASEDNRDAIASAVNVNESTAVDDIAMRANALTARASVGLSCPEEAITSRPLETSEARIVSGCGRRAIYEYSADSNGVLAWHREQSP
jgi:hypothetical protein